MVRLLTAQVVVVVAAVRRLRHAGGVLAVVVRVGVARGSAGGAHGFLVLLLLLLLLLRRRRLLLLLLLLLLVMVRLRRWWWTTRGRSLVLGVGRVLRGGLLLVAALVLLRSAGSHKPTGVLCVRPGGVLRVRGVCGEAGEGHLDFNGFEQSRQVRLEGREVVRGKRCDWSEMRKWALVAGPLRAADWSKAFVKIAFVLSYTEVLRRAG
jgi:uncharacterized protein (TIGR03382 family)